MTPPRRYAAVLVYDGDCAFCERCVDWMRRRLPVVPETVAWQQADLAVLGLARADCERAVQWVEPGHPVRAGAAAVARALVVAGGRWRVVGRLMQLPGVRRVADVVYAYVARNRDRMPGGSAECALPSVEREPLHGEGPAA